MRLHRGMCVGACLLLAAAGCSKKDKTVNGGGVYSPIITGISSNHEPAARGAANVLTAQVTNVNGFPLTYHWRVQAGTLADSTTASVTWTPPDSIGTFDVTVSIVANDGDNHFFKTMTVHMSVDNEFTRWTQSDQVQFDPAPTPGGGVLYAEYHNVLTKSSDAYRVDTPLGGPVQLTSGFFFVGAPSPRADQVDFAFTARVNQTDSVSIYLLPFGGGDATSARVFEARGTHQNGLATPRFAPVGTLLAYQTDSINSQTSGGQTVINYRDGAVYQTPLPIVNANADIIAGGSTYLSNPVWGHDGNSDGAPDSLMAYAVDFPGTFLETVRGLLFFPFSGSGALTYTTWLPGARIETPDLSPDGHYVVFTQRNAGTNDRDIWIINRAATSLSQAKRVTFGPADDSQPRFSPDGSQIFFISNRVDRYGVTGVLGTQRRGYNVWSVAQFDRP